MEVMMDLDLTIPYQSIKSNLLEHLGHTKAKARRQTWTSKPGDNQSPRSFLAPIVRNIQRLSKDLSSQKDFVKELFLGVLTLHYSESMSDAFVYLTNALSCEHTLTMPREHDQLLVQTDASMEGIGAVLSVIRDNEESRRVQWPITPNSYLQRRKITRSLSLSVWRWLGRLTTLQSTCLGVTSHW